MTLQRLAEVCKSRIDLHGNEAQKVLVIPAKFEGKFLGVRGQIICENENISMVLFPAKALKAAAEFKLYGGNKNDKIFK